MKKPYFSVVLLSFNRPEKLKIALDSVCNQIFKDYEVIVVDASSSNKPQEVTENCSVNLSYFHMPDKGIGAARYFGIEKARGEWVAFLDDDDAYLPNHLAERKKMILENPSVDLFYNGFKTIGSQLVPDLLNPGKFLNVEDSVIAHAGTVVIKTEKALATGGFKNEDNGYYPDNFLEMANRVGLKTYRIIEPRTYIYNRWEDSYTGKLEKKYKKISGSK